MPDAVVNRVREVRERRGDGLRELARAVGISPAYLHDIEHGRRCPAPDVAERINACLHAEAIVLPPTAEELQVQMDTLRAFAARACEMLRHANGTCCRWCHAEPHAPDCALAALLREGEALQRKEAPPEGEAPV